MRSINNLQCEETHKKKIDNRFGGKLFKLDESLRNIRIRMEIVISAGRRLDFVMFMESVLLNKNYDLMKFSKNLKSKVVPFPKII